MIEVSYFVHYDTLLQNARDIITKCDGYFIPKCVRFFITKCDGLISNWERYDKTRRFYFKMWQLLQNVPFITKCVGKMINSSGCNKRKKRIHERSLILISNRNEPSFYDMLSSLNSTKAT